MNKLVLISILSVVLVACNEESASTKEAATSVAAEKVAEGTASGANEAMAAKLAAVAEAKAITKAFGGALKGELKAAMKAGGPLQALDVCNKVAMPLTAQVAKEKGAMISRVSLKNRNPANVPNEWQKKVLEDFDARAAKGEDIKSMGFSEVVETDGKQYLHFMKALPAGNVCLKCHGSNIDAAVQEKITALYPADKAVGYEKGQVRGAIVIVKEMK